MSRPPSTLFAWCIVGLLFLLAGAQQARAQATSSDWAWKPVITVDSVAVSYVFYSEADNKNNGVVLKIANYRTADIRYKMTVVMRGPKGGLKKEVTTQVEGTVGAQSLLTGDEAGLFFVPFTDGTPIGELGLRAYRFRSVH